MGDSIPFWEPVLGIRRFPGSCVGGGGCREPEVLQPWSPGMLEGMQGQAWCPRGLGRSSVPTEGRGTLQ